MAKIFYIGSKKEDIDIDVAVEESTTQIASKDSRIYSTEILKFVISFLVVAILIVLTIFSASALRSRSGETMVVSQLTNEEGEFQFKGWEMTPALEAAIENGNVSLKDINVIEKGGDITFSGGDAELIDILYYRTEIEDNKDPQIYSNEYFEELRRKGQNVYVVKTIGLATEATEKEGAE